MGGIHPEQRADFSFGQTSLGQHRTRVPPDRAGGTADSPWQPVIENGRANGADFTWSCVSATSKPTAASCGASMRVSSVWYGAGGTSAAARVISQYSIVGCLRGPANIDPRADVAHAIGNRTEARIIDQLRTPDGGQE